MARPYNKYIAYLTLFTFLVLYIIAFVFIFNANTEIISFGCMTIFSIFFLFFLIDTIGSYMNNFYFTLIPGYIWFVLFASISLKIAALVLILIMFRGVYTMKEMVTANNINKPKNKNKKSNIPPQYRDMINDYKILFIINMVFIFILFFMLMYNYSSLNSNIFSRMNTLMEEGDMSSFTPLIGPIIMVLIATRLAVSSGYEVYIGNELYKLNGKRVVIA
jgi:hypothetical protein